MGGPSGPRRLLPIAATGPEGFGPEGPPATSHLSQPP
ncbi:DUF6053 domain-containing protein [Lysobacter enzymogenes]